MFSPLVSPIISGIKKLLELFDSTENQVQNLSQTFENLGYTFGKLIVPLSILAFPLIKGIFLFSKLKDAVLSVPNLNLKVDLPNPLKLFSAFTSKLRTFFLKGIPLPLRITNVAGLFLRGLGLFSPIGLAVSAATLLLPHIPKVLEGIKNIALGTWDYVKKGASFLLKTSPIGLLTSAFSFLKEKLKSKEPVKEAGKEVLVESSKEIVEERFIKEEKPKINVNIGSINLTINVKSSEELPQKLKENLKNLIRETVIEVFEEEERRLNLSLPPA